VAASRPPPERSGGPGYSFSDENLSGATYNAGTVAMANAGPNTNGSQFFLVFQDSQLSPAYTPFGTISVVGLSVLRKVAQAGTTCTYAGAGGGVPKDKVVINSVTITKG
jgi:peptidyl-prolyl cis-trans isomerase B (cyclophilin B)